MNISLKKRVGFSYAVATLVVFLLSITVYYHLATFHDDMKQLTINESNQSFTIFDIRINILSIIKSERILFTQKLSNRDKKEMTEKMILRCEDLNMQLSRLEAFYKSGNMTRLISEMKASSELMITFLRKVSFTSRGVKTHLTTVSELSETLLDNLTEILSELGRNNRTKDAVMSKILKETKRYMMITLIIGFLVTIILGLVVPGKLALPFKKIKDAIRELQECNFDVSIYYKQNDEIGEIATEMNRMIKSLKHFEELRTDRIGVENRKFDALANMVKRPVLVANAAGNLIYMNNRMYNILQVQSEDVIGKAMDDHVIPRSIISCYELAIKRRSKIENEEVVIKKEIKSEDLGLHSTETPLMEEEPVDGENSIEKKVIPKETHEVIFQGFANIIPIRGKESSLDYYLMVLSTEVFT